MLETSASNGGRQRSTAGVAHADIVHASVHSP